MTRFLTFRPVAHALTIALAAALALTAISAAFVQGRQTRRHVNELRDRLLVNGRSEHLTRRVVSVLKLILDHAIDNG